MSDFMDRYLSLEAKDLNANAPILADWNAPVERTQGRDRTARPINDALGQAHNVSYYDQALDAKLGQCTQPTLRILDLPKDVGVGFWKDEKGYYFFFKNGQDRNKPHYIPPVVNKIEVVQNGKSFTQDLAQVKPGVDQAVAAAARPTAPPAGDAGKTGVPGKAPDVVAGGRPPGRGLGGPGGAVPDAGPKTGGTSKLDEYNGKGWHQPGKVKDTGDVGTATAMGFNRWAQRGASVGSEYYFGKMALANTVSMGTTDAAALLAKRNGIVGTFAAGEVGKYAMDSMFFPNANPSLRTYLIDGAAPAVVLTALPWYGKVGVVLGAHLTARLWDKSEGR